MGFLSVNFFLGPFFTAVPVPTHIPSGMSDLCASLIDLSLLPEDLQSYLFHFECWLLGRLT